MTYPDQRVGAAVSEHFTACKLESGENYPVMKRLGIRWLPGIVLTDGKERVHHSWVGFLPPEPYLVELLFGRGMAAFGSKQLEAAEQHFETLVAETPGSERAPEALYWQGVSRYRQSGELADANRSWARMVETYPQSLWARKVEIFLDD